MVSLTDLILLRDAGVAVDDGTLAKALMNENLHRDVTTCAGCCVVTFTQHQPSCPRASVLVLPDRYDTEHRNP